MSSDETDVLGTTPPVPANKSPRAGRSLFGSREKAVAAPSVPAPAGAAAAAAAAATAPEAPEEAGAGFLRDLMAEIQAAPTTRQTAEEERRKKEPPALDSKLLIDNVQRFSRGLSPFISVYDSVVSVQRWTNPYKTGMLAFAYLNLIYHKAVVVGIILMLLSALLYQ